MLKKKKGYLKDLKVMGQRKGEEQHKDLETGICLNVAELDDSKIYAYMTN